MRSKFFLIFTTIFVVFIYFFGRIEFDFNKIELLLNHRKVTAVSPLYTIKITREFLQSKFVFGDEDLAYWYFGLAEKRITEAEILKSSNLNKAATQTAQKASEYQTIGSKYLKNLIDVIDVNYLKQIFTSNQERLTKLKSS